MKITDRVNGVHCYVATVRIKRGKTTDTAKSIIYAENATQARNLLTAMYGYNSIVSVNKVSESDFNETVQNKIIPRAVQKACSKSSSLSLYPQACPRCFTRPDEAQRTKS